MHGLLVHHSGQRDNTGSDKYRREICAVPTFLHLPLAGLVAVTTDAFEGLKRLVAVSPKRRHNKQ